MIKLLDLASRLVHAVARVFRAKPGKDRERAEKPGKEPPNFIYPLW
jgi:hypothetical protein